MTSKNLKQNSDKESLNKHTDEMELNEKHLSHIYDTLPEVIFLLAVEPDDCFRFISVNRTFLDITRLSREQVVGKRIEQVFPETSHAFVISKYKEAISENKTVFLEQGDPTGERIVTVTPVYNAKQVCTHLAGKAHDLTERKLVEEKENIRKITLLSESAMRFVEFSPDEDIYNFIGEQLRNIVGEKSCIVINSINKEKQILTTRSVITGDNFLSKIIKHMGQHPVGITYNSSDEALDYLSDGKLHFSKKGLYGIVLKTVPELICNSIEKSLNIEKIYTIGFIKDNRLSGTVIIFLQNDTELLKNRDIVEAFINQASIALDRKRAEEELRILNEELEQRVLDRTSQLNEKKQVLLNLVDDLNMATKDLKSANERLLELDHMKSMFIASTSHELRTPLNSIIGFSSILLEGWEGKLNAEQKEEIGYIHTAGKQLLDLINDIIDISKIEAGKLEIDIREFMLNEVIDESVSIVKNVINEKGLDLEVETEDIIIVSDRRRLLQCLINLLSNAVKFTDKGMITVHAKTINSMVNISVTDTGMGIKPDDIQKLFAPFVRVESTLTAKTQGTGLGLYLTKKLTEDILKGTVEVTSKYGTGSTFTIKMPVKPE